MDSQFTEYFRETALTCSRLASTCTDRAVAQALEALAVGLTFKASELEEKLLGLRCSLLGY
jgi:hypothetical protein